ncbi:MAG: Ig-like domain-containing protein [Oscillospiraceae bacterium]|nr:Ig-like domain-containing protein [Oscillospiraceae bacterium]
MKHKRLICLLLALLMFAAALPGTALAAKSKVKITDMSSDFLSGYYVVYDYNGKELRSDLMGANANYDLWKMLSPEDKKAVLTNFAFGQSWLTSQFGKDNVAQMNNWWNDVTGWAGARDVLKERIAKREFPRAYSAFGSGSFSEKSTVELPEVEHKPTEAYTFLPEVRKYFDNEKELKLTWDVGYRSYGILKSTKEEQVAAAVTSLSGDLISLICERALVPGITPGGLSALAPNLTGELLSIADKILGISDKVIEKTVGKRLDASTARKIIDQCWEIINLNEQYCEACIEHFLFCKSRKADLYQEAADAVAAYIEENGTLAENAEKVIQEIVHGEVTPIPQEFATREECLAAYEAFRTKYSDWINGVNSKREEYMKRKAEKVMKGAFGYSSWPAGFAQADSMKTMDLSDMYTPTGVSIYSQDGERRYTFIALLDGMSGAFTGAKQSADEHIEKMESYIEDYNNEFESICSAWQEFKAEWLGFLAVGEIFGVNVTPIPGDDLEYWFKRFYKDAGTYGDESLDSLLQRMRQYRDSLDDREKEWDEQSEVLKTDLMARYERIKAIQERHDELGAEATKLAQEISDLLTEVNDYYYDGFGEVSDELKARLQAVSPWSQQPVDFTAYQKLYDELGEDLQQKWETYETAHDKWRRDQNEMMELEQEMKGVLGTRNYTYNSFYEYGDNLALLSALGGSPLKTVREMQKAHLTAGELRDDYWDNTNLANPDEGEVLYNLDPGGLKKSYAEFSGKNGVTAEAEMFYDQMLEYKPNYLRFPERRESIKNALLDTLYSNGLRGNSTYTLNFYAKGSPESRAKIEAILAGWAGEAESYKPVTALTRGAKLMDDEPDAALVPGQRLDLSKQVKVEPLDATDRSLIWESSDYSVCWVDEKGMLTGQNPGDAVITVRATDSAWVIKNGERVYTPEPISFTVRVGAGAKPAGTADGDYATLDVFEDGAVFDALENDDGSVTVSLGVGLVDSGRNVAVCLYSGEGRLYEVRYLYSGQDFTKTPVTFKAPRADGLTLKIFAIDEDGFTPLGESIAETSVK